MSNNTNTQRGGGIGFLGALFLVFLVLKLTGVIAWSWLWITAPLWGPLLLLAVVGGIVAVAVAVSAARTSARRRKRNR